MQTLQERLDALIAGRSMLQHSFYTRWQHGELTRDELRGYAKEYYAFEKEFPRFVSAIHSRCEDADARRALLENLVHEESGDENHPELWLRFAEGLGLDRAEVLDHVPSDQTAHLLRTFRRLTRSDDVVEGLAALYAYERQQPRVATTKIEGLQKFNGAGDARTTQFFRAHEHYDVAHSGTEIELLDRLCTDEAAADRAAHAVADTLDALYAFLDGVERRYGAS
jgi:pyrroloquinoline-quinone synthase